MHGLTILLCIAGVFCFFYFLFLQCLHVDFAVVWLAAAVILGGFAVWHLTGWTLPSAVAWVLGVCLGSAVLVFGIGLCLIFRGMNKQGRSGLAYLIVLGAQVRGERPSRSLLRRIERAERYLKENPATIAILSGGQGDGEEMTEASCMSLELQKRGIAKERLLLEENSTSTKENLLFSAKLAPVKQLPTGLVTQNFHVYRSVCLARHQKYQKVEGIAAASEWLYQPHFLVREVFALMKEYIVGNIG